MKTIIIGIILGIATGIIDIIPMIIKKLTWDANISAFLMWVIVGFLIATTDLNMNPVLKGILIAFLVLTPCAVLTGLPPHTLAYDNSWFCFLKFTKPAHDHYLLVLPYLSKPYLWSFIGI